MRILFQRDSITDARRSMDDGINVGIGYPLLVKAVLGLDNPGKYGFINRAISGNGIVDVYARIKIDIINIKPDVMNILIGINNVWHKFFKSPNGINSDKFYKLYEMPVD